MMLDLFMNTLSIYLSLYEYPCLDDNGCTCISILPIAPAVTLLVELRTAIMVKVLFDYIKLEFKCELI